MFKRLCLVAFISSMLSIEGYSQSKIPDVEGLEEYRVHSSVAAFQEFSDKQKSMVFFDTCGRLLDVYTLRKVHGKWIPVSHLTTVYVGNQLKAISRVYFSDKITVTQRYLFYDRTGKVFKDSLSTESFIQVKELTGQGRDTLHLRVKYWNKGVSGISEKFSFHVFQQDMLAKVLTFDEAPLTQDLGYRVDKQLVNSTVFDYNLRGLLERERHFRIHPISSDTNYLTPRWERTYQYNQQDQLKSSHYANTDGDELNSYFLYNRNGDWVMRSSYAKHSARHESVIRKYIYKQSVASAGNKSMGQIFMSFRSRFMQDVVLH